MSTGTELRLTEHWDNSSANKWNRDPTAEVCWDDQSSQEMLSAEGGIVDGNVDPKLSSPAAAFGRSGTNAVKTFR